MWWEKHRITRHYNAELQTSTQTLRATKYSIESTYSDLPCDLKVNRGKLALINRPWKCKKRKDRRSPLVHSRKLAEHDDSTRDFPAVTMTVVRDRKIRTALRTNQIAGFVKKQLCNRKVWDFTTTSGVRKLFGTFEKQAAAPLCRGLTAPPPAKYVTSLCLQITTDERFAIFTTGC